MATLITIAVATYCIILIFLMIEKKIHAVSYNDQEELNQDDVGWIDVCEKGHRLSNFAAGLSDTPTSKIPCCPLEK